MAARLNDFNLYLKVTKQFKTKADDTGTDKDRLLCCACESPVTSNGMKFSYQGSSEHNFTNPEGISFHLGCFNQAQGCEHTGVPTLDNTWFNGCAWSFAHCRKCQIHLGWRYQSDGTGFYGLILDRLIEEDH